jgi:CyaY protein
MNESEFLAAAGHTLDAIESAVDAVDADIDAERTGSVLTLQLADGSKVIVNSQAPMRQIWVAAKGGGFHYEWREGHWCDTRDGSELFASLSRLISAQGGTAVRLRPR